jgi:eukaryotic-like serine/threonine-protein kinase
MPLAEDTILENRFRIDGPLAFGGMGAIYRAYDTNLQVQVAIKENYFSTPESIEQFKRESLILARLRHPALPRVLQHFEHEGQQYLVMELIEGRNLWEMIKERGSPFSEAQALEWIDKICEAVSYLHNQNPPIIHRDIKPQNIKVMPNHQVVLVDFGVAKQGGAEARTATGARGVTPGFSPPEQCSGSGSSPASDVYALGATLYALLTGKKPPDSVSLAIGESEYIPPDKLNSEISRAVAEAINWAMQVKPANRPQSVEEWRKALRQVVSAQVVQKPVTPPRTPELQDTSLPVGPPDIGACSSCGWTNPAGLRFCEECGNPLAIAPKTCSNCGSENPAGMRFCEECGNSLMIDSG